MKAIILAAGKWTRLLPITENIPKAMVEVHSKPIIEYNMERLIPYVNEFIIIVKYKKEAITEYFWNEYKWIKISYHEQGHEKGTGAAIKWIDIKWGLVIAYADAIISQEDIDNTMREPGNTVFVKEVPNPEKYGIFETDEEDFVVQVVEKPQKYIGNLANFGFFKINDSIFNYIEKIELSPRWELEITDAINLFVKDHKLKVMHLKHDIIDVTTPEDLERVNTLQKPELWNTRHLKNIWEFELHLGIPKNGIQEIVDYSLDETDIALRRWTSDWKKRFISTENLSSWYGDENRYPFTLLSKDKQVVWLWWWRPAKSPNITEVINKDVYSTLENNKESIHTSWVRIYPSARWQGLAKPFIESCSEYYSTIFSNIHMCIDIDEENIPSQKAFEKAWFQKVGYGKNINNSPESWSKRFVYMRIPQE